MLRNKGWQKKRKGNERKDWGLYTDECRKGKEMVMKALNKWIREKGMQE
jgi:hypothetical protein